MNAIHTRPSGIEERSDQSRQEESQAAQSICPGEQSQGLESLCPAHYGPKDDKGESRGHEEGKPRHPGSSDVWPGDLLQVMPRKSVLCGNIICKIIQVIELIPGLQHAVAQRRPRRGQRPPIRKRPGLAHRRADARPDDRARSAGRSVGRPVAAGTRGCRTRINRSRRPVEASCRRPGRSPPATRPRRSPGAGSGPPCAAAASSASACTESAAGRTAEDAGPAATAAGLLPRCRLEHDAAEHGPAIARSRRGQCQAADGIRLRQRAHAGTARRPSCHRRTGNRHRSRVAIIGADRAQ